MRLGGGQGPESLSVRPREGETEGGVVPAELQEAEGEAVCFLAAVAAPRSSVIRGQNSPSVICEVPGAHPVILLSRPPGRRGGPHGP